MRYPYNIAKDALWKEIIEVMTKSFIRFFFPDKADEIDFSKGYRFLDTEFSKLFPEQSEDAKDRRADKLIEVILKSGETLWLLIHVEVQGYVDADFARRMFDYYYRIMEKYGKPVTAIAIFTDDSPGFRPSEYRRELWGTELIYRFNTYKLLDKTLADFADTDNPFSIIMETAWHDLKRNKLDDERLETLKITLIRRFLELNYSKERIVKILRFLSFYVNFDKKESTIDFVNKLKPIIKPFDMTVDEIVLEQLQDYIAEQASIQAGVKVEAAMKGIRAKVKAEVKEEVKAEVKEEVKAEVKEEVKAEVKEEVKAEVKEEVREEIKEDKDRDFIFKLQKQGFTNEQISNFLVIPLEELERLISHTN